MNLNFDLWNLPIFSGSSRKPIVIHFPLYNAAVGGHVTKVGVVPNLVLRILWCETSSMESTPHYISTYTNSVFQTHYCLCRAPTEEKRELTEVTHGVLRDL